MLWRDGSGSVFVLDEWNFGDVFRDEEQFKKWILFVSTQLIFLSLNVAIFTKIIYDNQGMRNVINIKGAGLMWRKLQSPFFSEIGSHFFQNIGGGASQCVEGRCYYKKIYHEKFILFGQI